MSRQPKAAAASHRWLRNLTLGLANIQSSISPAILIPSSCLLPSLALAASTVAPGGEINPDAADVPQLRPPKPELPPGFWERYGLWVALGALLFLVAVAAITWFLMKGRPPAVEPPERTAREALGRLRDLPEDGMVLSRVSQVLRRYIASVLGFEPGELTTTEFCRVAERHETLGPELGGSICGFLRLCDERKFSSSPGGVPLAAAIQALKFIDLTEEQLSRRREQERSEAEKQAR